MSQTRSQDDICLMRVYPPWSKGGLYYGNLHLEIEDFVQWISPTEEEKLMRIDTLDRVKSVIKDLWADVQIEPFGSFKTELCVPNSDLDLVVFRPSKIDTTQCLYRLSDELVKRNICYPDLKVLATAKVPIIKLVDIKSHLQVDIAFDVFTGTENTKVVLAFLKRYPLVKPLALVIKYFLKIRALNDTWSGGIGSYTLVIMIIHYLQLLSKSYDFQSEANLAELLIGFFEFYGHKFDYVESVISVTEEGRCCDKKKRNWFNEDKPQLLSVEDPHNPDIDVGSASFKIEQAKYAFADAFDKLTSHNWANNISLLSHIIYVPKYIEEFRTHVKLIYGKFKYSFNNNKIYSNQPRELTSPTNPKIPKPLENTKILIEDEEENPNCPLVVANDLDNIINSNKKNKVNGNKNSRAFDHCTNTLRQPSRNTNNKKVENSNKNQKPKTCKSYSVHKSKSGRNPKSMHYKTKAEPNNYLKEPYCNNEIGLRIHELNTCLVSQTS